MPSHLMTPSSDTKLCVVYSL